jgi:ABC-type Fe3+ transport system substrate-binding protein
VTKHRGILIHTSISGIVYNPALVKPAEAPTNYEDLIDPVKSKAWAGKMSMPPYPDWLVELSLIWPRDKVVDFARKLISTASGFVRYEENERLVTGEFVLMANEGDGPEVKALWASKGAQLEFVPGSDPAQAFYFQLGVPKNSASPNLATLFSAYVASPEGQEILNRIGFQGSHLVPTTDVAKYIAKTKLKLVSAEQLTQFYDKGGDPELSTQITQLMKR